MEVVIQEAKQALALLKKEKQAQQDRLQLAAEAKRSLKVPKGEFC